MESFWNWVMIIGLIGIFIAGGLALYEFKGAKRFCDSINGDYNLKFFPLPPIHYCNDGKLIEYSLEGWSFEKEEFFTYSELE